MEAYGQVYKIVCSVTEKVYVGQTTQPLHARFRDHCNLSKSVEKSAIRAAINKHGKHTFTISHLQYADNKESLNALEIYWIGRLNSLCPTGYNISLGGNGGGKLSAATRKKISLVQVGKKRNPWSVEWRMAASKRMTGMGNHRFGRMVSPETVDRMSIAHKIGGKAGVHSRIPVRCVESGVIFPSSIEVIKDIGISGSQLRRLLRLGAKSQKYGLTFVQIPKEELSQ